jgi:hypothetical protein
MKKLCLIYALCINVFQIRLWIFDVAPSITLTINCYPFNVPGPDNKLIIQVVYVYS